MEIKIVMLDVGDADDMIVNLQKDSEELTLVVDAGKRAHGDKVVSYLDSVGKKPDIVIGTHLDEDHIGGLAKVISHFHSSIDAIWVHVPQDYYAELEAGLRIDQKAFPGFEWRDLVLASINDLNMLICEAEKQSLKDKIFKPFSDQLCPEIKKVCDDWNIKILGPSLEFYKSLISSFRSYPGYSEAQMTKASVSSPCDLIGKDGKDSPENESSLIFQISSGGKEYLFTGDAGLQAFGEIKSNLGKVHWLKVPHHGSRRNMDKEIIEKLMPEVAFISASGSNGHPDENLVKCLAEHKAVVKCTCNGGDRVEG